MILGIDPGVRKLGYAIIDGMQIVDGGVLILDSKTKLERPDYRERMSRIRAFFVELLDQYPDIDTVSMEKLFAFRNYNNMEFVYGVRGMLMTLFREHHFTLHEYTPLQLKKYIAGTAKASKEQMITMISRLYQIDDDTMYHDTADAIGLAYLAYKGVASSR
ncbi:MAG: crossover junction endodeoxyribonuclease RuvC [Candidatus Peribacteria bacterium]|nr:MAG: crossover junction endodeoxyribonuclease RuvC [Candidatus Peribacteria bacterium]